MSQSSKDMMLESIRTIRQLKDKVARYERRQRADIAIVGMACRFPGADDIDGYWRLLCEGRVAVEEVKRDRWDNAALVCADYAAAGKVITPYAGMIEDIYDFDAEFFGVSRVEAENLDPQQRLLLENSWLALEDAGLDIPALRGSATGVFVGIGGNDYGSALMSDARRINAYIASGNSQSMAAGRLSYFYDFIGPSLAIDTACSSSLVAVNEACQKLRLGECDLALAAGVNSLLTPQVSINFSRARMLTSERECHVFDARAKGYVRGEGCAVLVLKRLPDAVREGDRVHAIIKGSSVNHNGRSSGLTVPNGPAQEAVIRAALQQAGVMPREVAYVEAHGTGTSLGDPIEANALARVYASSTDRAPLFVGSVKANIGHLEAAAGIAGLIKAALVVRHGLAPPQPGFDRLNPKISWDPRLVQVATARTELARPSNNVPLYAGVSSFGFSGTNAHAIVTSAPPRPALPASATDAAHVMVVSARSASSLRQTADDVIAYLRRTSSDARDQASHTSTKRRAHAAQRIAAVGTTAAELADRLDHAARAYREDSPRRQRIALLISAHDDPAVLWQALRSFRWTAPTNAAGQIAPAHIDAAASAGTLSDAGSRERWGSVVHRALLEFLRRLGVLPDEILVRGIDAAWVTRCLAGESRPQEPAYLSADRRWRRITADAGRVEDLGTEAAPSAALEGYTVVTATELDIEPSASTRVHHLATRKNVLDLLADLYGQGVDIDWQWLYPHSFPADPKFPRTRFERQTLKSPRVDDYLARATTETSIDHPLLLGPLAQPGSTCYPLNLASSWLTLLSQHRLRGRRIAPASLLIEIMRHALADALDIASPRLSSVEFLQLIDLDQEKRDYLLQVRTSDSPATVAVWSRPRDARAAALWTRHVNAHVGVSIDAENLLPAHSEHDSWSGQALDVAALYVQHQASQVELGDAFRCVRSLRARQGRVQAEIVLPAGLAADALTRATVLLDGCFQATAGMREDAAETFLLGSIGEVTLAAPIPESVRADITRTVVAPADSGRLTVDIAVVGPSGTLVARFRDVVFQRNEAAHRFAADHAAQCYVQRWTALPPVPSLAEVLNTTPMRLLDAIERIEAIEPLAQAAARHGLNDYNRYRAQVETVCLTMAAAALTRLGWSQTIGDTLSLPGQWQRLGIIPAQHLLVARLVAALCEEGYLDYAGSGDAVIARRPLPSQFDIETLLREFPAFAGETRFIQRCAVALPEVLSGRRDPLDVLFSSEALQGSEAIYLNSPISRVLNEQLARLVAELSRGGRRVRILEIGAGTGGTSRSVLAALSPQYVERYCYTDVSPLFLERAQAQFTDYAFVDYRRLNIEEPVAHQGVAPNSFDIVIAANVLHATRSIRETLHHVSQLLAPGGCLLLRECIKPQLSADISFGMTSGWWRFEDTSLRRDYPLLSSAQWCEQLARHGFELVRARVPDEASAEAVIVGQATARPQRWLVAHGGQPAAQDLVAWLARGSDECREIRWGEVEPERADPTNARAGAVDHLVYFPPVASTASDIPEQARQLYEHLIAFCRVHLGPENVPEARLWCITGQAEKATEADRLDGLAHSVLAGVIKCAALEFSTRVGGIVDLQAEGYEAELLAQHIRHPGAHNYVALRDGQVWTPQLWPCDEATAQAAPGLLAHPGTVLITGGLGGIGYAVASALSQQPGLRLVLIGRDVAAPEKQARLARLRASGAQVLFYAADVGNARHVENLFAQLRREGREITSIVHAAGVGGDQPLAHIQPGDGRDIVAAKLDGTWNLHRYSDPRHVRAFVVLSTMLSLWGAKHKTHYVLANHFADRVVHYRHSRGLPGVSLQLGPVDCGMLDEEGKRAAERVGVSAFEVDRVVAFLLERRGPALAQLALLEVDWARFKPVYQHTWLGAYFDPVGGSVERHHDTATARNADDQLAQRFARQFAEVPDGEREHLLESLLIELLREVLGLSGAAAKYRAVGFHDLGMDSLLTLAFAGRLSRRCGVPVSSVDVFDNANVANLQKWLGRRLRDAAATAPASAAVSVTPPLAQPDTPAGGNDSEGYERELLALEELLRE